MRNELELISTIEKYLNNELSAEEKTEFEKKMSVDQQLQETVALQQEIMGGIENLVLKEKIEKARKKFYRIRNFTKWGLTGLAVVVTIISILFYFGKINNHKKEFNASTFPEYNELHKKQ